MSATDKAASSNSSSSSSCCNNLLTQFPQLLLPLLLSSACSHKHNKFLRLSRAAASPPKTKANYKFIMRESNFMTCGFSFGYRYTLSIRNVEREGRESVGLTSVKTQFTVVVNQGTSCKLLLVMLSQQPPSQNNKRHCRRPTSPYLFD